MLLNNRLDLLVHSRNRWQWQRQRKRDAYKVQSAWKFPSSGYFGEITGNERYLARVTLVFRVGKYQIVTTEDICLDSPFFFNKAKYLEAEEYKEIIFLNTASFI